MWSPRGLSASVMIGQNDIPCFGVPVVLLNSITSLLWRAKKLFLLYFDLVNTRRPLSDTFATGSSDIRSSSSQDSSLSKIKEPLRKTSSDASSVRDPSWKKPAALSRQASSGTGKPKPLPRQLSKGVRRRCVNACCFFVHSCSWLWVPSTFAIDLEYYFLSQNTTTTITSKSSH